MFQFDRLLNKFAFFFVIGSIKIKKVIQSLAFSRIQSRKKLILNFEFRKAVLFQLLFTEKTVQSYIPKIERFSEYIKF